jgi:cell surface protein SprA
MFRKYLRHATGLLPALLALVMSAHAQSSPAVVPSNASGSSLEYIPTPPSTHPLQGLLPKGGIGQHPAWGYLKMPERNLLNRHEVDFESREVRIHALYYNTLSRDTTNMWTAYYQELTSYTFDMFDIGFRRLWLNSLIGQKDGGSESQEGSLFDISIPVNMPAWMKDLGLDKPKLQLQGTMNIKFTGIGTYDDAPGSTQKSLWPSPNLSYEPSFLVKGKIGRNITVEINNTESGLGVRNQLKVVYAEATPGEFEDFILQRVELGSTSLSLKGTELTGYSETHTGLFGVKADFKVGDWNLTAIASQDGGSTEKYKMRSSEQSAEGKIEDRQFVPYKYYFLTQKYRADFIASAIQGSTRPITMPVGLELYTRPRAEVLDAIKDVDALYYDANDNQSGLGITSLMLVKMSAEDWSWNQNTGTVVIKNGSRNTLIVAAWNNAPTHQGAGGLRSGQKAVLVQTDGQTKPHLGIEKLMLRNVYNVGLSQENATGFVLRMKNQTLNAVDYLKTLGVLDSASGSAKVTDDAIFPKEGSKYSGEMWLPCLPASWYVKYNNATQALAIQRASENCLEPLRAVDSSATIKNLYTLPVASLTSSQYAPQYSFYTVGKLRSSFMSIRDAGSSYSVNSGNCIDIAPGSETLKIKSDKLVANVDYSVNYELGQIELLSEKALNPNNEIEVTYECEPLFQIDNKLLLGGRAEYPIKSLSDKSLFGLTALYKSQSTTQEQPRFGGEPYSSVLLGANLTLQDSARWMDRFTNALPFIDTKARSQWTVEGEVAASYHNANTSANKTALLDDFENSLRSIQYSTYRTFWYPASPPGGTIDDPSTYIPLLDFKHKGEFIWHSNQSERYRNVYTAVGNTEVDSRELPILKFTLRPNDNLEGNSWGGVMRANGTYNQDLSDFRYLEVVARGNVGNLFVDLGAISEDVPVGGMEPNREINTEADPWTAKANDDNGIDGVGDGTSTSTASEVRVDWNCRVPGCIADTVKTGANPDLAQDNFSLQENDTDPDVHINGTEGNNGPNERPYDTEDLNDNRSLEVDNRFVRYRINLESTDLNDFEELKNGWRRWRIPLSEYDTIVSGDGTSWQEILGQTPMTRIWYGRLKHGVVEGQSQILDLRIVGNQWTADSTGNQYGVVVDGPTQTVIVDGMPVQVTVPGTVVKQDTNYLRVRVLNNRDDAGTYFKSEKTVTERDAQTSAALKEQSLVMDFGGLHKNQAVSATRFFDGEEKDLTQYQKIQLEILYKSDAIRSATDSIPVRFAVQLGLGGPEGSTNYYEWSYTPRLMNSAECTAERLTIQNCHEQNWDDNRFVLDLSKFVDLKKGRGPRDLPKYVSIPSSTKFERNERVGIVGNPSIGRVNWVRFVVIAQDSLARSGSLWVNDLRLSGMSNEWGVAARLRAQMDFADLMTLSGELNYRDGAFATLKSEGKSPKPTLAESNASLEAKANYSLNINKFFKDEWMLHMPLSLSYDASVLRPYLKPQSDERLSKDDLKEISTHSFNVTQDDLAGPMDTLLSRDLRDGLDSAEQYLRDNQKSKGFQNFSRTKSLSIGYAKEHTEDENLWMDWATQAFLERPEFNFRYSETQSHSATSADSSYTYGASLKYKLGSYKPFNLTPFKAFPSLVFEPWPQTMDVTLADFLYSKSLGQELDPNYVAPLADPTQIFGVDLKHKIDMRWNILPFLTAAYSLGVERDMNRGHDRQSFTRDNFFDPGSENGLFARKVVFDYDTNDCELVIAKSKDSVAVEYKVARDGQTLNELDSSTYNLDTTWIQRDTIVDVGDCSYGRRFGVLRNERSRTQDFKLNFNPMVIPFLPTRFTFGSTFQQNKTIPTPFSLLDPETLKKNFWSIEQTNRFEVIPTVKLVDLFGWGSKNKVTEFLNKWKLQELRTNWSVDVGTKGEDFTLYQLRERQKVTPAQYYLYGLGIGDGKSVRNFWDLVTGDMNLNRDDYEQFAEYRNRHVDTLVYQGAFTHAVKRNASLGSNLTLPIWDVAITGDLFWSEEFTQKRETPLYLDTTTTWPKAGVGVTIPNFASRLNLLKSYFSSFALNHRTDYTFTRSVTPFQNAEDEWKTEWGFSPLVSIQTLTKKNVHIDNDINLNLSHSLRRPKIQVVPYPGWPDTTTHSTLDSSLFIDVPWMHTDSNQSWGTKIGDELSIGYDLKTARGFQLFKWYFRLKNNINLKLNTGLTYETIRYRERAVVPDYSPIQNNASAGSVNGKIACDDKGENCQLVYNPLFVEVSDETERTPTATWEYYIRPNAGYQFNKMATGSAFLEYRYNRSKTNDGETNSIHTLRFEIALMLQFD